MQSSSTQVLHFTAIALSHRNRYSSSGFTWVLLLLSHKIGKGRAEPLEHIPASQGKAAEFESLWLRIQRRQHSSFLHLRATFSTFSLSCCSLTLLSVTQSCGKWGRAGEKGGIWELVSCEIHLGSPKMHQTGNLTRGFLQRLAFSLMSLPCVLHTLQQGAGPMFLDTYKVLLINWHLP